MLLTVGTWRIQHDSWLSASLLISHPYSHDNAIDRSIDPLPLHVTDLRLILGAPNYAILRGSIVIEKFSLPSSRSYDRTTEIVIFAIVNLNKTRRTESRLIKQNVIDFPCTRDRMINWQIRRPSIFPYRVSNFIDRDSDWRSSKPVMRVTETSTPTHTIQSRHRAIYFTLIHTSAECLVHLMIDRK